MALLVVVIRFHFIQNFNATLNVGKGGSMVATQCLESCQLAADARRISLLHFVFKCLMEAQEGLYLETCEKQASNKTYVDCLLALARSLDHLLDGLIVLF